VTSGGSPQWVEREGFRIDPAVVEVARGARMVAAPTDDGRDPTYATVRHAAAVLASQAGARVVLADRSTESRFVDPYGSGPMTDDAGPMYSHGERWYLPWFVRALEYLPCLAVLVLTSLKTAQKTVDPAGPRS
jgi:hypothetical protein